MDRNIRKIGIIECGQNRAEWLAEHGDFADWFPPFLALADQSLTFDVYKAHQGETPDSARACDAWLITGSPVSVYQRLPWQEGLVSFLVEATQHRPLVGICYGHQLLHEALGGVVEKSSNWGVGIHGYRIREKPTWLRDELARDSGERLRLIALHQDQVTELAPGARVLAGDAHCPAAITMIGENVLTFQAHPEMTPSLARAIYEYRRRDIGDELVEQAQHSLAGEIDDHLAARWIIAFLRRRG